MLDDSTTGWRTTEINITPEMIRGVISELRGINFEFESEEDAALRIIDVVIGDRSV